MSDYERATALTVSEIKAKAQDVFGERIELRKIHEDRHGVTYHGTEGVVTLELHRHGMQTTVTARTDQLRTSRLDNVVRYLLNQFPYQPGDPPRSEGS